MARPRLKAAKAEPPPSNGTNTLPVEAEPETIPLRPLNVSGVVVNKKELVEALRIYVPLIADIQAFEDGEHFYLVLSQNGAGGQS